MKKKRKARPVVNIVNPAFQSSRGRSFAGTSNILTFGGNTFAWARLVNPSRSKVNLFLDFFNITNFSKHPFSAFFFIDAIPPGRRIRTKNVTNLNTNVNTLPRGVVQFNPSVRRKPVGGVNYSERRVPGNESVTSGQISGKVIIGPGNSILIFLTSSSMTKARVGFEWWERKTIF
ncbi:DUF6143 family protein [Longirhabdus pacifica]|uniref:DUF6143 family protein n=1 Tax=Longirhabdus pacifica TaxID=2305227 RepID=UPI001008D87A|nr:DUF6143 family protein [Longirhabdus pacifica]